MLRKVFELPMNLTIGHPVIDDDHARMVRIINETAVALEESKFHEATKLIFGFIELMREHMVREEEILHGTEFPWVEEHAARHRQIMIMLPRLIDESEKIQVGGKAWDALIDKLIECLLADAFEADLAFKAHLAGHRV